MASRAVYSCRSILPSAASIRMGSSCIRSSSASSSAALSYFPAATASVIWNTSASSTGSATASMSATVMRFPLA